MPKKPTKADLVRVAESCGVSAKGTKAEIASRVTQFGYNATEDKGRRQAPQTRVRHESKILTPTKRKKLQATAQEQMRNYSLPAWMVRKHLDYVSKFHVSIRTGEPAVDALVQRIFKWHGAPARIDIARRFGRDELFRLFELEKVVGGDAVLLKLPGVKLQAIESDLVRLPGEYKAAEHGGKVVNSSGLVVDEYGGPLDYCICNRGESGGGYEFDHLEPAANVIFDGYWTRFGSQFRGVSPLSTAINTVQDIHEGFEWNLIKAKMHALLGIAIMRDPAGTDGMGGAGGATSETASADATTADTELDLNPRTVTILDLNPGEKAEMLESHTPSGEFVEGSYLFIQIAMLALDIPVTSFDSRRSSFSARIADLNEYEVSCDAKRTKNRYVRQDYSDWLLKALWDGDSDFMLKKVAGDAGMSLRAVQEAVEWVASGSPWLDKLKQVMGDKQAIALGLDNHIDAARRRGSDVFKNIDKQKAVLDYAKKQGVPIATNPASDDTVIDLLNSDDDKEPTNAAPKSD